MLGSGGKVLGCPPERQTLTIVLQNCEESTVNYPTEKYLLHNFIHLFHNIVSKVIYAIQNYWMPINIINQRQRRRLFFVGLAT